MHVSQYLWHIHTAVFSCLSSSLAAKIPLWHEKFEEEDKLLQLYPGYMVILRDELLLMGIVNTIIFIQLNKLPLLLLMKAYLSPVQNTGLPHLHKKYIHRFKYTYRVQISFMHISAEDKVSASSKEEKFQSSWVIQSQ